MNHIKKDLHRMTLMLEKQEKSVTATIDNIHQKVQDILAVLNEPLSRSLSAKRDPSLDL
jgi:hypothetical protein